MHFVTLSLFFFLLLVLCRLGHSCVFLQFMPERKLAPATKLTVFLSLGPHFRLDDVKTFRSLLALKRFNVVRRFPVHFPLHPTHS
jgi:hypothetical protein